MKLGRIFYWTLIIVCLALPACRPKPTASRFKGIVMSIPYTVQIGNPLSEGEQVLVEETILSTFALINDIYNNWNPESEISKLNQLPARQKVALSPELANFLHYVDQIVKRTEGRFDPTVEPIQLAWKQSLKKGHLPEHEMLTELAESIGWDKVHIEKGFFWKDHPQTAIDLGGIAKGYAVDLLIENLSKAGFTSLYAEWGGEIRTTGLHPGQREWRIGIEGFGVIDLTNGAIATSGSYLQKWTVGGVNYTHIIDPSSKKPLENPAISSVSVAAPTCVEADALATALMLFPSKEAAKAWADERGLRTYIW